MSELLAGAEVEGLELPGDGGPPVCCERLEQAKRARLAAFDELVVEVLEQAPGAVGAGYLRARLGGPRWKLQASLRRLVAGGKVERRGVTSATVYRLAARRGRAQGGVGLFRGARRACGRGARKAEASCGRGT